MGFGHIEFATTEAAQKALELNGLYLLTRPVRLDIARERGAYTVTPGVIEEVCCSCLQL
ncbi:unnamed protein product [Amaranthus hypochondriacus]